MNNLLQVSKPIRKVEDSNPKKTNQEPKEAGKSETVSKGTMTADAKKVEESQCSRAKKELPKKEVENKDEELSVILLKIQIGLVCKACQLTGKTTACLAEELTNHRVVLITNVKPGKLRDVLYEGLVLCASSKDHTLVEPLIAPDGAKVGECVTFSGLDGKPEEVLNSKKKQLDKITPNLFSDEKGIAKFKGIPFMTSSGLSSSSIFNGSTNSDDSSNTVETITKQRKISVTMVVVSVIIKTEALQQRIAGDKHALSDHSEHRRNKDARAATTSHQWIIVRPAAVVVVVVVVMPHFFFKST
ncbi:aminoacyl tRNA synthase complex-interacting multifunctional protein 1-like [Salvia divinorum]|uniref:Aminoacyl tRNA synthase complex-interacting multifunctional protein 1-like n=1 Tax=Salvia divinorum TaxID=28513 RepID=A0ABD1HSC4_SALDI